VDRLAHLQQPLQDWGWLGEDWLQCLPTVHRSKRQSSVGSWRVIGVDPRSAAGRPLAQARGIHRVSYEHFRGRAIHWKAMPAPRWIGFS